MQTNNSKSLKALRDFLRWVKREHPKVIEEYIEMLEGAMEALKEIEELKKNEKRN